LVPTVKIEGNAIATAVRVRIPAPVILDLEEPGRAGGSLPEQIAALAPAGVYALQSAGRPPYLSSSSSLRRRLTRLLVSSPAGAESPIARLRRSLTSVECWATGSRLETLLVLYELSKLYYPGEYLQRLHLRIPWFIGLTQEDSFPRLRITNRLGRGHGAVYGPFRSRDAAQAYEQEVLGLFQIRRCSEPLVPHADHPGCIYGEMNQCLRPCQNAVTEEEYATEAGRVEEFLTSNGKSALSALSAARDRACEETDFEQAAQIHKRFERVTAAAGTRDDVIREIHHFDGVALTRASGARRFRLWPMLEGLWQDSVELDFSGEESRAKSLDHEIRERLAEALGAPRAKGKRVEELAIFSRWYFSSWRDGEWLAFRTLADLNYRRLVRQISSMLKAETAPPPGP
jgi:excinuclease ABC subunit C